MKQKRKKNNRRKGSDASRKVGASKASKDEPGVARKEDSERQDQGDGRPTLDSFITESLFHKKRSISSLRKDSYLRIALGSRYISTPISMRTENTSDEENTPIAPKQEYVRRT
uniref:Uncharacterized protein n=1 Tax=Vespula pensylvanica TaxID=30213 RepID=A0A834JLG3_VESPE|nr:hypothetical protein H0235_018263 [Vespula pensylvanica]